MPEPDRESEAALLRTLVAPSVEGVLRARQPFPGATEVPPAPGVPGQGLSVDVRHEGDTCVIEVVGELDVASHPKVFAASTAGRHPAMVIDISGVTFMDCSGFGALVAARLAIEGEGRSLVIRGGVGQPAQLLGLISELDARRDEPGN